MPVQVRPVGASVKARILVHGDIGVGKTTLIGSGAKEFKTLIIHPPVDHMDSILGSGAEEAVVRDWEDMLEVQEMLRHDGSKWDWVWLDSISLFQDVGLDDTYAAAVDRAGPARAKYGPDRGEYRVNMWRLEQFVRHTVGAEQFNFGITAHSFWAALPSDESPESSREQLMPWIQGKAMPQKICGYMNVVGYMEVKTRKTPRGGERTVRLMHTNKTDRWYAKNQFTGAFGDSGVITNPTMPDIIKAINDVRPKQARRPARRPTRRGGSK